eukprot:7298536-Prymnesium_polylepis.1
MQRMLVIGFVQWIPHTQLSVRTLIGWVVSSVYLGLLVSARPYKRSDVRRVAFAVQFCTVLIFCMSGGDHDHHHLGLLCNVHAAHA